VPVKKTSHKLGSLLDDVGLKVLGVYRIPCKCGKVYIGQTGRSTETRCKEHTRHLLYLYQPQKSAVAEHSIEWGHQIKFKDTEVLTKIAGYIDRLIKATEIRLHPNNIK
jgi:hypothetical protein